MLVARSSVDFQASEMCVGPASVAESTGVVGGVTSGGGGGGCGGAFFAARLDSPGRWAVSGVVASRHAATSMTRPDVTSVEYHASLAMGTTPHFTIWPTRPSRMRNESAE